MDATKLTKLKAQYPEKALSFSDLPPSTKDKIKMKYAELMDKHPHMKPQRLLKKAGEYHKVKIEFE